MNSLLRFGNRLHFRAGRGGHGQGRLQNGAKLRRVCGCRGFQNFVLMHKHETLWFGVGAEALADVGIAGAPNAGKGTLSSVISAAQPNIANYPFTSLLPNLGIVSFDYDSTMVVADLPGLLEGAHRGFGCGHEFLCHTESCSALVHVVDSSTPQPELEFEAVSLELERFSPEITEEPYIAAFNKMDLPDAYEKWPSFKEGIKARRIETFCMRGVQQKGTHEVTCAAYDLLRQYQEVNAELEGWSDGVNLKHVAEKRKEQRRAAINDLEIFHDNIAP